MQEIFTDLLRGHQRAFEKTFQGKDLDVLEKISRLFLSALKSGKLAAAGLDVFKGEPNFNPTFRELDNVFMLPHLGSATKDTRIAMGMRAVDNLAAFFKGERPRDLLTGA